MLTDTYLHGVPADSRAARPASLDTALLSPENMTKVEALNDIAKRRGHSRAQMTIAWVLRDDTSLPG